ncbi:MAG: type VI secretion system tip protein VgrG [Chitinispirillaceae bacterium]|nr:type VI secretion system tip protein VgrG [Chitinispirillaceae bacterium]
MPSRKANEAQFHFICGDLDERTFEVADFSGVDIISTPYRFDITLLSVKSEITPDEIIGKPTTLYIFRDGEYVPYSGIVNEFELIDRNTDFITYNAHLVPKLWLLSINQQTRIFQNLDVTAIIKQVLDDAGITEYEFAAKTYPKREFVVQYQESDLNFVSRLMENAGLWYFFKEPPLLKEEVASGASIEKVVITDKPSLFADIDGESMIRFRSASGLNERIEEEQKESVNMLHYEKHVVPKEVLLKNYNYRKPEVEISGKKPVKNGYEGTVCEYGGDFKEPGEAQDAATVLSNRIQSHQATVSGTGNCRGFRAGFRFTLEEHFRDELNTTYVLTRVNHTGGHLAGGSAVVTYENHFRSISAEAAETYAPVKKTVVPKVNGVLTAMVEANGGEYAQLDETGRYKIRMPFDLTDEKNNCKGSKYMRLAQPYSGPQYGMHFPVHEGAEMVFACIDGDPNKPIGIGTVPHANTISPVIDKNRFQNLIRTAGGNELLMHDEDGKQRIQLTTNNKHVLNMDDEKQVITLSSTDKNALVIDDTNTKVTLNSGKHGIEMSYADGSESIVVTTANGHIIKLDDANEKLTVQTKGGHIFEMDDSGNKIVVSDKSSKNTVTLDGGGGLILDSKGKIEIKASQDLSIQAANIAIKANGKIEAKAAMDMKLQGMNLEAKGDMNVKAEAGMNMEIKGGIGAKVEGGVQANLKGTMTTVEGSAMTTVKGALVMIN